MVRLIHIMTGQLLPEFGRKERGVVRRKRRSWEKSGGVDLGRILEAQPAPDVGSALGSQFLGTSSNLGGATPQLLNPRAATTFVDLGPAMEDLSG